MVVHYEFISDVFGEPEMSVDRAHSQKDWPTVPTKIDCFFPVPISCAFPALTDQRKNADTTFGFCSYARCRDPLAKASLVNDLTRCRGPPYRLIFEKLDVGGVV